MRPVVALRLVVALAFVFAAGCAAHRQGAAHVEPAQAAASSQVQAPAAGASAAAAPAALVNPNQAVNDREVAAIMKDIAGHEKEPAEQVFRNIELPQFKSMPAERLLRVMNFGYSRALGVACAHCHVEEDYASDDKRPKRAAREMVEMNKVINERLRTITALERAPQDRFVNCTTCHRGAVDPTAADR
ncbi:MAG TPA: c-type cytochrome [Dongiaceae bacterium]|nr:c-type cytochrome [Dongiaceae bacterium]